MLSARKEGELFHNWGSDVPEYPLARIGAINRSTTMLTKTSIVLALIAAICSSAVAAEKRQIGPFGSPLTIVECTHGTWDAYGLRCDSGTE